MWEQDSKYGIGDKCFQHGIGTIVDHEHMKKIVDAN